MVIPDMLKNAPMIKNLEARIKVNSILPHLFLLPCSAKYMLIHFISGYRVRVHCVEWDVGVLLLCELG